jgi:outer membrane protein assembly factor BamB
VQLAAAAAALLLALAAVPLADAGTIVDWSTWGNGPQRLGRASSSLLLASNAGKLRLAWSRSLGGAMDAQPLFVADVPTSAGAVDVYVAASERGRVAAYVASSGKLLWSHDVGFQDTHCAQLPGGFFGVTGTPVYDRARNAIYVAGGQAFWALDASTGATLPGWPIPIPGSPAYEHVWGALALAGSTLYAGFASYCDREPYKGRLVAIDVDSGALSQWLSVPTPGPNGGGGIWGWGGPAIDPQTGDVLVATANAHGKGLPGEEAAYDAESLVELTPGLQLVAHSHAPGMPVEGDYGFGSTPVLFRPRGCAPMIAAEGKDGVLYVWRRDAIDAGPTARLRVAYPATLYGLPAWDAHTGTLLLTTTIGANGFRAGLLAFKLDLSCRLRLAWSRSLGGQLSSTPTIANDTVLVDTGTKRLRVFRLRDGAPLASLPLAGVSFVAPIAVGGDVAAVSWGRELQVFRLP